MDQESFDIIVGDPRWSSALADAVATALECRDAAAKLEPRLKGGATLLLADDDTLRDLNRRFRGQDKPTNVLSFPAPPAGVGGDGSLGDIAIAFETCAREAEDLNIAFRDHARHLIVHGLLHLVGCDHQADDEAERMERLETRILSALGVADPYGPEGELP